METISTIIGDTKRQENENFQQCEQDEVIEVLDSPPPADRENHNYTNAANHSEKNIFTETNVVYISNSQEEPIDLTFERTQSEAVTQFNKTPISNPKRIIIQAKSLKPFDVVESSNARGIKRNFDVFNSTNQQIMSKVQRQNLSKYAYAIVRPPLPDLVDQPITRQQEILKMAKSIFSKRTRTLYHWMYPTASKHQIKQVVSNTWDSMASQEKNIYIAQVLGRFGCSNANLMVNPQLGQIKELPPIVGLQKSSSKTSELQNAISSISCESDSVKSSYASERSKKKVKVPKKKLAQSVSTASQEFDDDPELSHELAQFSIMLKNQF